MAQLVKNLPVMQDPWVGEIPWSKGKATHSSILALRIPWTTVLGVTKSQTQLRDLAHRHVCTRKSDKAMPFISINIGLLFNISLIVSFKLQHICKKAEI